MLKRFEGPLKAALGLSLLMGVACGDDDNSTPANPMDGGTPDASSIDSSVSPDATIVTPDGSVVPPPPPPAQKAVYAFTVGAATPDGAFQYVVLRDKLDFNFTLADLRGGKEFGGYAGIAGIGGHIIVGDAETPFATKWKIEENLTWTEVGQKLNFSNYITEDGDGLNFFFQAIKGSDMFLYYGPDRTSRVHWNVDEWKILGEYKDTKLPVPPEGFTLGSNGNRGGIRDWKGPITQTFSIGNDTTRLPTDTSYIAVYDEATKAEKAVLEIPCPAIQQATMDEEGNLYYGAVFAQIMVPQLYGQVKPTCMAKVLANGTLDPALPPTDMKAWTGGFPGLNFRYLRNGKALLMVLRTDRLGQTTFEGAPDPALVAKVYGAFGTDDKYTFADKTVWEQRIVDIKAGTSKVITGWENDLYNPHYMHAFTIEGRSFLIAQYDPYGDAKDTIYEVNVDTATVTKVADVPGTFGGVQRLR
ncbi:MAG: hypothetical protein ABW352_05010 [Polyangiales bacterium]